MIDAGAASVPNHTLALPCHALCEDYSTVVRHVKRAQEAPGARGVPSLVGYSANFRLQYPLLFWTSPGCAFDLQNNPYCPSDSGFSCTGQHAVPSGWYIGSTRGAELRAGCAAGAGATVGAAPSSRRRFVTESSWSIEPVKHTSVGKPSIVALTVMVRSFLTGLFSGKSSGSARSICWWAVWS